MTPPRRTFVIATVAALLALAAFGAFVLVKRERPYDRSFDTRVAVPAYRENGPVVLFDEGHLNACTIGDAYKPLADLLRSDGYTLRASKQRLTREDLKGTSILVLPLARGANEANDADAYSPAEVGVVEAWVREGGSLLLVTDQWPYGSAMSSVARRFGVDMGSGLVQDPTHCDPRLGDSHLVFSTENGLLRDHPILRGRNAGERIRRVLTFAGQSLRGPAGAVPFLSLSNAATERPPDLPRIERSEGNVQVFMDYGPPISAAGRSQGIALVVQSGRVVILGDADILRAQRDRDGVQVGMSAPGYDNRQLALNIFHWLSRAW